MLKMMRGFKGSSYVASFLWSTPCMLHGIHACLSMARTTTIEPMTNNTPKTRGRVRWSVVATLLVVLTGVSGLVAITFASAHKPHVAAHTILGYCIFWLILLFYGLAYVQARHVFNSLFCLLAVALLAVLTFIHIDDVPARISYVYGRVIRRPAAGQLYWAVGANGVSALLLVSHFLFLGRGNRRKKRQRSKNTEGNGHSEVANSD